MAWPSARFMLKARVSGVAFALALQCEFESLAAWTARGEISVAAEVHGGVLSVLSEAFCVLVRSPRSIPCL